MEHLLFGLLWHTVCAVSHLVLTQAFSDWLFEGKSGNVGSIGVFLATCTAEPNGGFDS